MYCEARWQSSGTVFPESTQGDSHSQATADRRRADRRRPECGVSSGDGKIESGRSDHCRDRITAEQVFEQRD